MKTHAIDPSGDVILFVENPNAPFAPVPKTTAAPPQVPADATQPTTEERANPDVHVKVSGKHLTMASPALKKALMGSSKQNLDLKRDGAVEVHAEGWDIEAWLVLMQIFHCKPHELPKKTSVELMAKLGVLAEYYECIPLVRCYVVNWLTPSVMEMPGSIMTDSYTRDFMVGLWVSWVFNFPEAFETYSGRVIGYSPGSIISFGLPIPVNIIDALNERRKTAIEAALSHIIYEFRAILTDESRCTVACRSMTLGRLLIFLQEQQILDTTAPYFGVILSELVWSTRALKRPAWGGIRD